MAQNEVKYPRGLTTPEFFDGFGSEDGRTRRTATVRQRS